jgi:hypothetical protein
MCQESVRFSGMGELFNAGLIKLIPKGVKKQFGMRLALYFSPQCLLQNPSQSIWPRGSDCQFLK